MGVIETSRGRGDTGDWTDRACPIHNVAVTDLSTAAALRTLDLLPDPVLLVRFSEAEGPQIVYGNEAAGEHFRLAIPGVAVGAALRQPVLLESVENALETGAPAEVAFESIGVQPRYWRAFIRPLGPAELVLVLRDETDARRAERMRADFLANASHELRTPLASLAGFVETLRTHAKDDAPAREKFLGIMAEQTGRMTRLINDLLSLSRIELNEHIAPSGAVDLVQVLQDVADGIRPLLAERGISIAIAADGPAVVVGDRDQLVQVVQNLVDNAVKYSPTGASVGVAFQRAENLEAARAPSRSGGVTLSLLTPDAADQAYQVIRVADVGRGIARQHLPRLSERFYRVEGQSGGGTGLGLAIVKHVINRHRGGLIVESEEGAGATFTAFLPAATVT